jgi:RNA polymerase sigma factor (sigma-70 family)
VVDEAGSVDARKRVETVYREQRTKLWRALVGYTGDPEVATDSLAEAFAQLLGRADDVHQPERWVWKAAFAIAAGELAERAQRPIAQADRPYEMPEPTDHLLAALSLISPNQRLAVVLHDYADRPTDEIAEFLGVSRATVHVHLSQARRRLRKLLEDDHE